MNFIINGFLYKSTLPIISRILEEFKVKNCHLTGYYSVGKIKVPPFTKVKVYYQYRNDDLVLKLYHLFFS